MQTWPLLPDPLPALPGLLCGAGNYISQAPWPRAPGWAQPIRAAGAREAGKARAPLPSSASSWGGSTVSPRLLVSGSLLHGLGRLPLRGRSAWHATPPSAPDGGSSLLERSLGVLPLCHLCNQVPDLNPWLQRSSRGLSGVHE